LRNRVGRFVSNFASEFIRRRTQRKICEGFNYGSFRVPGLADIFDQFTPQGLEHFINKNGSVIDLWLKCIPEHLQNQALLDLEKVDVDTHAIARSIVWDQVMDVLAETHPEHVRVVKRHPRWYAEESGRAIETFLKVAPRSAGGAGVAKGKV